MTSASHLFKTEPSSERIPLYEAKMFHQFDHRWATYTLKNEIRDVIDNEKVDPMYSIEPRYWIKESDVDDVIDTIKYCKWFLCFRDIARATDERTFIASVVPKVGVGHTAPMILSNCSVLIMVCFIANLNSITSDYCTRIKVGGTHLTFFIIKQLPVLIPSTYSTHILSFIVPRVLELAYTAWDIKAFADDIWKESDDTMKALLKNQWDANKAATGGHAWDPPELAHIDKDGIPLPPFKWDPERRAILRAELDAYYAKLYGLTYDELRYILDPKDVYGEDFPGETFRVLKEKEIKKYGEYRTRRLVLEAWERV